MKKLLSIIFAICFIFGVAGQAAAAAFNLNDLIQVVYNENDNEVAVNLGSLGTIDLSDENVTLAPAGTVNLGQFITDDWSDLSLAFFGATTVGYHSWFATTKDTLAGFSKSSIANFQSASSNLYSYWSTQVTGDVYTGPSATTISYDYKLNSASNAPGYYGGLNSTDILFGEADLLSLNTVGYADMYLYHINGINLDKGSDLTTDYTAVLRLYADGHTVLNPAAVPVPASLLLLGSGLLGLLGINRKKV